jgi:ketosteroid isomerase-like protein
MAERDLNAFGRLVAEDTLFFNGREALRGRAAVLAGWKAFFDGAAAPFSWEPDQVEVLASGQLAWSTGPVKNAQGVVIARFNSIWQRQGDGRWLVIFDKGGPPDPPAK